MTSILLAIAHPLGSVVLAGALVLGAEEVGLPVGWEQVSGGLVAFLILREVFSFLRAKKERGGGSERLEVQQRMASCLDRQTEILERMEQAQASVLQITTQYQATGICPWTRPLERERTIQSIGENVEHRLGRDHSP